MTQSSTYHLSTVERNKLTATYCNIMFAERLFSWQPCRRNDSQRPFDSSWSNATLINFCLFNLNLKKEMWRKYFPCGDYINNSLNLRKCTILWYIVMAIRNDLYWTLESIMGGALSFKKHIYSRVHKNVLASMDSFPLHKNTEWGDFF